jgi:hypothetical protein
LVADIQLIEQMLTDAAIGDQQVDAPAQQFAEVGFMGRRRFAGEQCRFAEVRAVQITRRGADGQAAQFVEFAERVRPVVGVEHHELDVRQRFDGVEQGGVALVAVKMSSAPSA